MPVIDFNELPTFVRLRDEGFQIADKERDPNNRQLHIGILNLMPDAALEATERQFIRLLSGANSPADVYVHVFTVPEMPRQGKARAHVDTYYRSIEEVKAFGLDALILTGANPANPELTEEPYWCAMIDVIAWAEQHVCSVLCSCLATHAVVRHHHDVYRIKLPKKRWGVYSHRITEPNHPLVRHVNTRFDAPHSHVYEVTAEQLKSISVRVLAESEVAGVHLAVSADQLQFVFFQGHPEYDFNSLFKEYKREVFRFADGTRDDYPPSPEFYFNNQASRVLEAFAAALKSTSDRMAVVQSFPEAEIEELLENSWADTGKSMVANWLRLVEDLCASDRQEKFRDGVDPSNPLAIR